MVSSAYRQQTPPQVSAQQNAKQAGKESLSSDTNNISQNVVDAVQVRSTVAMKNLDTVRAIEQMHASLNQLAKGVRETNEAVSNAVELVDSMKGSITSVEKNLPPLPVDSKERNARLMEYSSLRKQLISLMVPPPPPPVYEKVKHMWDALFTDNAGTLKPEAAPELSSNSSDAQLKDVSQTLETTSTQLANFSSNVTKALLQP